MALVAVAVFAAVGLGADKPLGWPPFRGPGGSGVAEGQKPPVELGPDKNVKWKVPIPNGLSSPVVAGRGYDESYLSIRTPDVLARIQRGDPSWEQMVPAAVAEIIKVKNCSVENPESIVGFLLSNGL